MANHNELIALLAREESRLLERKPAGVNARDIRQTVVAFANSVVEGEEGVLLIGVRNNGSIEGCANADALQIRVREVCEKECYPPIRHDIEVLHECQNVVAVVIPPSNNRPHFSGPAFVRRGSESVSASVAVFDELIYSRNSKVAQLLRYKSESIMVQVVGLSHRLGQTRPVDDTHYQESADCKITDCNAQYATFQMISSGTNFSEPIEHITITRNEERWCPVAVVKGF